MENPFPESHESLWRRRLPAADQAKLHGQPELELEARLTEALARLPQAPVPSNFTARVLAAIELEEARATRKTWTWRWNWHAILPRFAAATAVLLVAGLGIQRYETGQHRAQLARSLSVVASAQTVPSVEALENLEVIQRMSQPAHADVWRWFCWPMPPGGKPLVLPPFPPGCRQLKLRPISCRHCPPCSRPSPSSASS